jgi:hypothetical protein
MWFLICGTAAKHLPETSQRVHTSNIEITLENDTLIEDFPFDSSNETSVEFFDNVTGNGERASPNLETNSIQKIVSESDEDDKKSGGSLKKAFLGNDSIVCNDGSPAGYDT